MEEIIFGGTLMIALVASIYNMRGIYKAYNAEIEQVSQSLRKTAIIYNGVLLGLYVVIAVLSLIFLAGHVGVELVITFSVFYVLISLGFVFGARKVRYLGALGRLDRTIIIEMIVYAIAFILAFALLMFGIFEAN